VASERERLRNNIIDRTGMKPSGPQLNSLLAQKAATSVLKKKR